jgi:MraZ protein
MEKYFIGTYYHSLDEKSRVIVPSKLRELLGANVYINFALDKCLAVYPVETYERMAEKIIKKSSFDKKIRAFKRIFFASTYQCDIDKQGRIQLTKDSLDKSSITKDVVIVGMEDHIEIWDKTTYEQIELDEMENYEDNAEALQDLFEGE